MTYDKNTLIFVPHPSDYRFIDRTGLVFTRLTVLGFAGKKHWFCECQCGVVKRVGIGSLLDGGTKSCGCWSVDMVRLSNTKHGAAAGGKQTVEYEAYHSAKKRCENPKAIAYERYGGRGIEFRFTSFEEFLTEIGPRTSPKHSLDRRNNNGHYEKGNVRWATRTEQQNNRRNNKSLPDR